MPTKKPGGVRKEKVAPKARKFGKLSSKKRDVPAPITMARPPTVGIGASAGGLEAFEHFFTNMPPDTGMAFVLIQHLDPTHKSILCELLKRYTKMAVLEVEDGMVIQPNTVYVIPPNHYMAILNGKLLLLEPTAVPGLRTPIDFFFRSLAEDQKEKAICIVLSGTGTEGSLGLRAVKGEGGMAMVQDPESAKYDGMPRSAIGTGLADYILPPDKMSEQLVAYVQHAFTKPPERVDKPISKQADLMAKIFILVRSQTGHDFSYYKQNTILRRIERRMALNQISELSAYVRHMQEDAREAVLLSKEFLIGVTNFFRDKEAFEALRDKVIPRLFENRSPDNPVRVWVPGCATGEEAYSIAMLCQDFIRTSGKNTRVNVFATDIAGDSIEAARPGLYPDSIGVDVPLEFLERFFTRENSSFRVKKEIRDRLVFALQNVITDPPFSKIDLISCRNLLIYLGPELQKRVLPLFHYSLKREGFLFLGSSETIGEFSDYFSVVDRKWKLFKRRDGGVARLQMLDIQRPARTDRGVEGPGRTNVAPVRRTNFREVVEKIILELYGPTGVIINEKSEVLYIHGRASKYLEAPSGEFTGNILAMAREGLKLDLAAAIRKAGTQKTEIRTEHELIKTNGEDQLINLVVKPISEPGSLGRTLIVLFEDVLSQEKSDSKLTPKGIIDLEENPGIQQLEHELRSTKEYLQTTIEELETSNEELKSTNDELQSSNEELQSTNEEMETSKEELQSVNEELHTVNSELQQKIQELTRSSNDLNNLLASTDIGTIFLDTHLNVQRFTPTMTDFINLIQTDVGCPLAHIVTNLKYGRLVEDAQEVLRTLLPKEEEVQTNDDRWYSMRILPYRTVENVIDGVVITFVDTSIFRRAMKAAAEEAERQEVSIINTVREPLLLLDRDLRIESANESFYRTFKVKPTETKGKLLYDLANRQWDIPALRELLEKILPEKTSIEDFLVEHEFETIGNRAMLLNARQLQTDMGKPEKILLAIEDVTGRQRP